MKSIFLSSFSSRGMVSCNYINYIFFSVLLYALLSFKERNGGKITLVSKLFTQLSVRNKL